MTIHIITDSAADLPKELLLPTIKVVPLTVRFGEKQYTAGVDLDAKTFYSLMRNEKELPKSSAPSPYDFLNAYEEVPKETEIIVITISKSLSTTYNSAVIAKDMLLEKQPNRKIEVINSNTGSPGQMLLINEALELIEDGLRFEEIVTTIKESSEKVHTLILLETLENVVKGGRLSRTKAAIANALNIKLMLNVDDNGAIEVKEKIRGNKRALRRFVEQIEEYTKDFEQKVLTMSHSNCEEKALNTINEIKERYSFKKIILSEMGPLIGTYAGEGGLVISFKS